MLKKKKQKRLILKMIIREQVCWIIKHVCRSNEKASVKSNRKLAKPLTKPGLSEISDSHWPCRSRWPPQLLHSIKHTLSFYRYWTEIRCFSSWKSPTCVAPALTAAEHVSGLETGFRRDERNRTEPDWGQNLRVLSWFFWSQLQNFSLWLQDIKQKWLKTPWFSVRTFF